MSEDVFKGVLNLTLVGLEVLLLTKHTKIIISSAISQNEYIYTCNHGILH